MEIAKKITDVTLAISLFHCLLFTGCQTPFDDDQIALSEIKTARNWWLQQKSLSYDMVVRYEPHGQTPSVSPVLIRVRNDEAVSIEPVPGARAGVLSFYSNFETVDKMLDNIQRDLEEGATVTGSLHSELGYPVDIYVSPRRSDRLDAYYRLGIDKLDMY